MRLDQAKDRSIQKYLESSSKYGILVQCKDRSGERIANLPNTNTCNRSLRHTAVCIEKAENMKTKEELHLKVRLTPRLQRVVLKANSHSGQQDQRDQDARSSWDPPSESKSYRETWNNAVDCRIPGVPLSTIEQQDTNRQKFEKILPS